MALACSLRVQWTCLYGFPFRAFLPAVCAFSCLGDAACTSFTWVKDVTSPSYMQCRIYHFNLCSHADLRGATLETDYCKPVIVATASPRPPQRWRGVDQTCIRPFVANLYQSCKVCAASCTPAVPAHDHDHGDFPIVILCAAALRRAPPLPSALPCRPSSGGHRFFSFCRFIFLRRARARRHIHRGKLSGAHAHDRNGLVN